MRLCGVDGCHERHRRNGLCARHSFTMKPVLTPIPDGEWLPIVGYGDRYYINPDGLIWGRYYADYLKGSPGPYGHVIVTLCWHGRRRTRTVHQLVMETFVGPCPRGMEVRHLNGDAGDNRVSNLAYGTKAENAQDRLRHGTDPNARKTQCKHGHPFSPENTHIRPDGSRQCRACGRDRARAKAAARLEVAA